MVALLFYGVYLVDEVADAFSVSDNTSSIYVVEEATYPYSFIIVSFEAKCVLSIMLMMDAAR